MASSSRSRTVVVGVCSASSPGLLLGVAAGAAVLESVSFDQFTLTLVGRPLTLLLTTLALLLVVWLSQRPGLRALRRMDLAEVVRERTG